MANLKIIFRGQDLTQFSKAEDSGFEYYKMEQAYSVSSPTRSDIPEHSLEIRDDQIIELGFTDDTVWIGDNETLGELFPLQFKRGFTENELILPDELISDEQDRSLIKKAGIKLFKIFNKKQFIKPAVKELARQVENRQLAFEGNDFQMVDAGTLLFCSEQFELTQAEANNIDISKKYLLFIHGTGSSTKGSFGDLKGSDEWRFIVQKYEKKILAFQHRSFTASPLENIQALVKNLPDGIEVDIITHSRGGLVADILAKYCTEKDGMLGFDKDERDVFTYHKREKDLEAIIDIEKIVRQKKIKINKIIRVACPANGTTLASKKTNLYLNVTFNLIGLASGQIGNPVFVAFKELIMAAVESKDNTEILPGLESMNPDSPFIKALNFQGSTIKISAPLLVIGGSSELSSNLKSLIVLISKFFFMEKNDLVVDTESMKWGGVREQGKVSVFIEKSGQIDHFRYFLAKKTREAVKSAIEYDRPGVRSGFVALHTINAEERGVLGIDGGTYKKSDVSGKRPIAILVPGIMGSNLRVGNNLVWIKYLKFFWGELSSLEYFENNGPQILADSIVATSYKRLGKHLNNNYDLVTYQFDWRIPLTQSASDFGDKIQELLDYERPIKIIAHSMGGVLVRDFILQQPETWKKLNKLPGFKTVFLGSPLAGSYRIPYVLFGQDEMIRLLGKIDIKNSVKSLLKVFCNMPGILNLLPINKNGKHDFSDRIFWEKLRTAYGDESWPIPEKKWLDQFADYQKLILEEEDNIDYSNVVYIAGQSRRKNCTISSLDIIEDKLVFEATHAGDESVTWESGIPKKIIELNQFYYANVTHGSLSTKTRLFAAIDEILNYGSTTRLQNSLPKQRGAEIAFTPKTIEVFDLSEKNVIATLLGHDEGGERWEEELPIEISVSHGHLKYAKFPVLVGHFEMDAILSTEKVIDLQLNEELSRLHQLGLYPGPIGTNQIVFADKTTKDSFKGAVVVGLGVPGELSAYQLMKSIEKGVARYLTICNHSQPEIGDGEEDKLLSKEMDTKLGISVIAIANSYGGLSTDSSVRAIILGVQNANRNINNIYKGNIRGIEHVEIIEIYHDRSLSILKAVKGFEHDDSGEFNIVYKGKGINSTIGRLHRIPYDNSADWWTRISVIADGDTTKADSTSCGQKIKMSVATTGASEKVETLSTNTRNLEKLLEEMTYKNQFSPDIAKTMFELLIPLNFKEELKRQSNISWVLDKMTATYPWEMMQEDIRAMPLCIHSGMVRQLATSYYRRNSTTVSEKNALIVGDPNLNGYMGQLPGARSEGEKVTDLLRQQNFDTESLIYSTPSQIILKLFSKNYKIIHLAGHGVFNADPQKPTGMVIGDKSFLCANEIAQMNTVPELVFVNCCYLGKINEVAEEFNQNRNRLAANIGTQLIENGVKAVIVAGWAVDDIEALEFCEQFYKCMFEGTGFGDAVKSARKVIFKDGKSRTNTWGAFQCYGDPFYKISEQSNFKDNQNGFLIQEELEIELQNLSQQIENNDYEEDKVLKRIQEIKSIIAKKNIKNDKITELLAGIYAGLELYEEATNFYQSLKQSEKAVFSFRAMEQSCNIGAKNIVKKYKNNPFYKEDAVKDLDNLIADLKALTRFGKTLERLSLIGSAYKRKLIIVDKTFEIKKCLNYAIDAYKQASEKGELKDPYPFLNWIQLLQIKILSEGNKSTESVDKIFVEKLNEMLKNINSNEEDNLGIWDLGKKTNVLLTKLVLGEKGIDESVVLKSYESHWDKAGHRGYKASEIEHLEILLKALVSAKTKEAKNTKGRLEKVKEELIKRM